LSLIAFGERLCARLLCPNQSLGVSAQTLRLHCHWWSLLVWGSLNLSRGSALEQVLYLFPAGQGAGSTGRAPTAVLPSTPRSPQRSRPPSGLGGWDVLSQSPNAHVTSLPPSFLLSVTGRPRTSSSSRSCTPTR